MLKPADLKEIRKELALQDRKDLEEICVRLTRFKKDNKELLTYLLFWSEDEEQYIREINAAISEMMVEARGLTIYTAKKTIRKVVRNMNRYLRFSGNKTTDLEVRIHFCEEMNQLNINFRRSKMLTGIYEAQVKKIRIALKSIHEDLQRDYEGRIRDLEK